MATALFILGHAGSGKTYLAKKWVKSRLREGEAWCMIDKDHCGDALGCALMKALGLDPSDRDSHAYKSHVRDLEYQACLDVAKEQIKLGINVVLPGPWTKELLNGKLFSNDELGFHRATVLRHVYLAVPEYKIKQRIINRNNPRDKWKIENWSEFAKRLVTPKIVEDKNILSFTMEEEYNYQEKMMAQLCKQPKSKRRHHF